MKQNILIFLFIISSVIASAQFMTSPFQANNFLAKSLNNALDFDGVDDAVITTLDVNNSVMPITTWEAWVYPTANNADWRTIMGIEDGTWDRNVFVNGGYFYAGYGNGGWQITPININEWQHVAVVYNEASNSMKFYKNGVAFTLSSGIGIPSSAKKFGIGCSQQGSPNQFFQGKISEVRVWNVERSQAQIQANMNTELTGEETGLVAYYPFKQGKPHQNNTTITTLFDEVGTNNGTITNFALTGTSSNFTFGKIQSRVPRNNLVMHVNPAWRRSYSGTGTVLSDLTENGNNMNLLNSPIYGNENGGILNFNGSNQKLRTVNNAPITGSNKRTIGIWMRPTSFNGNGVTSIISTGGTTYNSGMFGVYGNGTNKLSFWGHNSDYISGQNILLENWNFIATTYDGTGTIKLHVNGATESVGRTLNTIANPMDLFLTTTGSFGEMMIYDRDLSGSDLAYIYNRTKVKYTQPPDGLTIATAATSAKAIKAAYPSFTDGVYYINLPIVGVKPIYCIMNSAVDGGGWMLAMKANSNGSTSSPIQTFKYAASYWTTADELNANDVTVSAGDAKYQTMNYFPAKDMLALWPDIPSNYNSSTTGGSINLSASLNKWSWLANDFNGGATTTLINFFAASSTNNKQILSDANNFAGKGTAFSSQADVRFYGFNYIGNANARVRWGFGWNENGGGLYPNGDQGSNDVSGGIGMDTNFANYSAGDRISCCQNTTGISRPARVEIYIR